MQIDEYENWRRASTTTTKICENFCRNWFAMGKKIIASVWILYGVGLKNGAQDIFPLSYSICLLSRCAIFLSLSVHIFAFFIGFRHFLWGVLLESYEMKKAAIQFSLLKKKDHWKIYFLGKVILSAVSLCSLIPETDLIFLSLRFFIFHRHSQNPIRLKRMAKYIAFINIWIEQIDIWRCSPIRIHPHYTKINLIWNHANHTRSKAI